MTKERKVKILVKVIKDDDNFLGYSPLNRRKIFASGNTKDEAFTNLKKIARLYFEFDDDVINIDSSYKKRPDDLEIKINLSEFSNAKLVDIAYKTNKNSFYNKME